MRFIITSHHKDGDGSKHPEITGTFDQELFNKYMRFNEEMHKAGVLVASEGLNPGSPGARVEARNGQRVVVDGPFAESKEMVGGFYILDVSSREEAIAWALKCPTGLGFDDVLDIRALTGESDLPPEMVDLIRKAAPTWSATFHKKPR